MLSQLLFIALFAHSAIGYIVVNRYDVYILSINKTKETLKSPPPYKPTDHAKVARTLVHKSDWAATGTISTESNIKGFPMVNIISIADSGRHEPSTGHIYFFLTMLDYTAKDLEEDNKITFMMSDDQDLSCSRTNHTDPMEPTCARTIISGKSVKVDEKSKDYEKIKAAFLSRHPAAEKWIRTHTFFLCTIDISNILVLDWYGGPHQVTVEDYYNVPSE